MGRTCRGASKFSVPILVRMRIPAGPRDAHKGAITGYSARSIFRDARASCGFDGSKTGLLVFSSGSCAERYRAASINPELACAGRRWLHRGTNKTEDRGHAAPSFAPIFVNPALLPAVPALPAGSRNESRKRPANSAPEKGVGDLSPQWHKARTCLRYKSWVGGMAALAQPENSSHGVCTRV